MTRVINTLRVIAIAIVLVILGLMVWSLVKISDNDNENIEEDIREEDEENG